jgi:hypothetical protein
LTRLQIRGVGVVNAGSDYFAICIIASGDHVDELGILVSDILDLALNSVVALDGPGIVAQDLEFSVRGRTSYLTVGTTNREPLNFAAQFLY